MSVRDGKLKLLRQCAEAENFKKFLFERRDTMKKLVLLAILVLPVCALAMNTGWGGNVAVPFVDDFTSDTGNWGWTAGNSGLVTFNATDTTARDNKSLRFRNADGNYQALMNVYVAGVTANAKFEAAQTVKPYTAGVWNFDNVIAGPITFELDGLWNGLNRGIQIIQSGVGDILGGAYHWSLAGAAGNADGSGGYWEVNKKYVCSAVNTPAGILVDIVGPAGSIIGGPKLAAGASLTDIYGGMGITLNEINSDSLSPRMFDYVQVTVPEPATIALLAIGGLALLKRKKA